MRQDFDQIEDGATVTLHPRGDNPIQKRPLTAVYTGGYFYLDGSPVEQGPDYYLGDVLTYCEGWS